MPEVVQSVETEGLAWGVRGSFRRYVLRVAHGDEILDGGGGSLPDGRLYFPVDTVTVFDLDALDAEIALSGGVRFRGHAGMIDFRLGELTIVLTAGTGMVQTGFAGGRRDLAEVRVSDSWANDSVATLVLASRLAPGAEELFDDTYAAGTPFDDMEIRISLTR
ncbi:HtaA domain-containing protein [Glaciibacter sp. 2TAF33]|uniref:HtaA domain-containing protein n=1 Tax=Glaciibacter sp. 2TAF33 TaxID=3233015 RepID=UPI003F93AF2C